MRPKTHWKTTKAIVAAVLGVLLAIDVGLGVFLWRTSRQSPAQARAQVQRLELQAKLRRAELIRGEKIRASLPQVTKDCGQFYESTFLDKSSGYSALEADLDSIATKAGLSITGTTYKETEIKNHGVTELQISADVQGSYPAIIHFIDGLQQSKNFYLLSNLSLASDKGGRIKLQLQMRTYFRA